MGQHVFVYVYMYMLWLLPISHYESHPKTIPILLCSILSIPLALWEVSIRVVKETLKCKNGASQKLTTLMEQLRQFFNANGNTFGLKFEEMGNNAYDVSYAITVRMSMHDLVLKSHALRFNKTNTFIIVL